MNVLPAQGINSFRTAQELSSTEPTQLRRTIRELETRIGEQDAIIAQQNEGIRDLAQKLNRREKELHAIEVLSSKPEEGLYDIPDGFKYSIEKEKLERHNKNLECILEEFEDGFWTLFFEQREDLDACLKALEQLPATPETKSLHAHVKREWQAIESAKKRLIISPVNALRQLADLERCVVKYILGRPRLTLTTIEIFRAEVLLETFAADPRLRSLSTNDSVRIFSAKEERKIYRVQALRAMRRAALMFPDKVKFGKKGNKSRLIRILDDSKVNWVCGYVITICYIFFYCNTLLRSFDNLIDGSEIIKFVLLGE